MVDGVTEHPFSSRHGSFAFVPPKRSRWREVLDWAMNRGTTNTGVRQPPTSRSSKSRIDEPRPAPDPPTGHGIRREPICVGKGAALVVFARGAGGCGKGGGGTGIGAAGTATGAGADPPLAPWQWFGQTQTTVHVRTGTSLVTGTFDELLHFLDLAPSLAAVRAIVAARPCASCRSG